MASVLRFRLDFENVGGDATS
ncbi:hypothetical protein CCACVL1_26012 [Corchorus capsularis]|uniref:Uncharacterized protein n=1 Tax=Corchorus capsularis TaxID=210143 RepID=A0A1R3GG67_COCAP|nr:hypothetical protein CCACVL1_26012 [Corchorus capsularis]